MGTSIKPTGFEHAAAALRYWTRRQEVVANNLANVDTDGFKGELSYAQLVAGQAGPVAGQATDLRAGTITTTGQPLDLAIAGDGFFLVESEGGAKLSRGGALQLDGQGRIVDARGHALLAQGATAQGGAAVTVPVNAARIEIDAGGTIKADGKVVGTLAVVKPAAGAPLAHAGDTLFTAGAVEDVAAGDRHVRQGAREGSNVHPLEAMVDMITIQRATGGVQKALSTLDAARGIAVSELGKSAQ